MKAPDCCELLVTEGSLMHIPSTPYECFTEITHGYTIKNNFTPTLDITPLECIPIQPIFDLYSKDFPVFSNDSEGLLQYSLLIFRRFSLAPQRLMNLLDLIRKNYFSTIPFHNFWHAFSVMQQLFVIAERCSQFSNYLLPVEYSYLLLTGLGHDLGHPGVNNSFLITSKNSLAEKYNNVSVLENFHASVLINLIKITELFETHDQKFMKKLVIEAILSTDMANHKKSCDDFCVTMQKFDKKSVGSRQTFINYVLHCADLGNQAVEFSQAMMWSFKVTQEFNQQITSEKELGIKISNTITIGNNLENIKSMQIGFIDHAILPMWTILHQYIPEVEDHINTIKNNKKKWQELTLEEIMDYN